MPVGEALAGEAAFPGFGLGVCAVRGELFREVFGFPLVSVDPGISFPASLFGVSSELCRVFHPDVCMVGGDVDTESVNARVLLRYNGVLMRVAVEVFPGLFGLMDWAIVEVSVVESSFLE